jgi:hypothetical protein
MGNVKGLPNKGGNIRSRIRSQQSTNCESVKSLPREKKEKDFELSERDVAFICSQTGKYFSLFLENKIF